MNIYPLVSIIIPCYNHERYVKETLDSALNQDYPNKQIIIIDDGSKDNSVQVIRDWIEQHKHEIEVKFVSRPNKGVPATLNEGIRLADGQYVTLIASDDILSEGSISGRFRCLNENKGKMVVIGDARIIDSDGNTVFESAIEDFYQGSKDNYRSDDQLKFSVINEWSVPGPVMLADKRIYDIIGPYPENLFTEDLHFYLNVIARDLLIFYDSPVASYRVHDLNMCRVPSNSLRMINDFIKSYSKARNLFKGEYRKQLNKKLNGLIYSQFKEKVKKAIGYKSSVIAKKS